MNRDRLNAVAPRFAEIDAAMRARAGGSLASRASAYSALVVGLEVFGRQNVPADQALPYSTQLLDLVSMLAEADGVSQDVSMLAAALRADAGVQP